MADAPALDIDHLRSWIGRQDTAIDTVTGELVRRFRATLGEEPGTPSVGEPAPRMLHWCLAPPVAPTPALGPDGHPARGGFLPPVPLPRRMWASGRLVFHDEIRVGDTVRRVSRIGNVEAKEGRSGTLCFVTVLHEIEVDGRTVLSETQDIVYRGADGGAPAAAAPPPAPEGAHRCAVDPSPPLLFRYSALTFNGHRIHYDYPYATTVEGYPGLVVHGPLQATLLYRHAMQIRGTAPTRFSFRGLSPAFGDAALFLNGEAQAEKLKLWTAPAGGPITMQAEAEWE